MKMYEMHSIPSSQIMVDPELIAPVNQSIDLPEMGNKMSNSSGSVQVNRNIKKFPWGEFLILGGLTCIVIYRIVHPAKNSSYGGGFRGRRKRRER